jgi:hypothetical protein
VPGEPVAATPVIAAEAVIVPVSVPTWPVASTPVIETSALPETVGVFAAPVAATPVTGTTALPETVRSPAAPVAATPVTAAVAVIVAVSVPGEPVAATPVIGTIAAPVTVTVPTAPVAATPLTLAVTLASVALSRRRTPEPSSRRIWPLPSSRRYASKSATPLGTTRSGTRMRKDIALVSDQWRAVLKWMRGRQVIYGSPFPCGRPKQTVNVAATWIAQYNNDLMESTNQFLR